MCIERSFRSARQFSVGAAPGDAEHALPDHAPGVFTLRMGEVVDATVSQVVEFFGAILEVRPGREGLLHTSRMTGLASMSASKLEVGQTVRVRIVGRNRQGKYETTMLDAEVTS